ncbi:hypothetical protein [Gorillibacterium timonense]|uniref:hypothetical protein n=1 Tax=Gorillibacterium timonense TaxID=1689269 RepID=UPI00071D9228|nr:hypothetical protein [Gorillibacterium timonense]
MPEDEWEKKKVLIMVKAQPQQSHKYIETVCTAGITEDSKWIRLYPMPFRTMGKSQQFQKYQWVEVNVRRRPGDHREQSFKPDLQTLKIVSEKISSKNNWEGRNKFVLPTLLPSVEYMVENYPKVSLGIIKPKEIIDLVIEELKADDKEDYHQLIMVFDEEASISTPIKKLKYKYSYKFLCNDPRCTKAHKLSIIDWELGALINNASKINPDYEYINKQVKKRFYEELCSKERDTHFILGNKFPYPSYMVLGVYYPKIDLQLSLDLGI